MDMKRLMINSGVLIALLPFYVYGQTDPFLVGWWPLDELSGNTAADSSGYGNHGTLHGGPVWGEGIQAGGLLFDGNNDYVDCGIQSEINIIGDVTVSAWIKLGNNNLDQKLLGNGDTQGGFKLAIYTNNKLEMVIRTASGAILNRDVAGGTILQTDTWYHVAGVYSQQGKTIKTYVDGQLDRSLSTGNNFMGFTTESFKIARNSNNADRFFKGNMDDVRVYRRVLSDQEIEALAGVVSNNDDCQYAKPISNVDMLPFDTTQATFDGPGQCIISPNIWYCYTSPCTGEVTVSTCGSQYDTMVAVYKGCGCATTTSVLLACNDDACGLQSQLTFNAVAGDSYLIEVGGYAHRTGQGVLTIQCEGQVGGKFDLGDAPDSTNDEHINMTAYKHDGFVTPAYYPTTFLGNGGTDPQGPIHMDPLSVAYLGKNVSLETESYKGPDEDGVSNIDPPQDLADMDGADDGLIEPVRMPHCKWSTLDYSVTVVDPDAMLWVNVWCDWNRDGDWDDVIDPNLQQSGQSVPEWTVQNKLLFGLTPGHHQLTTPAFMSWHPVNGPEELWMRITLSEIPWTGGNKPNKQGNGGSGPEEGYDYGETEDYLVTPDTTCSTCEDLNGDGYIDINDLWVLLDEWLTQCVQF